MGESEGDQSTNTEEVEVKDEQNWILGIEGVSKERLDSGARRVDLNCSAIY
jgi:hypothetical protein